MDTNTAELSQSLKPEPRLIHSAVFNNDKKINIAFRRGEAVSKTVDDGDHPNKGKRAKKTAKTAHLPPPLPDKWGGGATILNKRLSSSESIKSTALDDLGKSSHLLNDLRECGRRIPAVEILGNLVRAESQPHKAKIGKSGSQSGVETSRSHRASVEDHSAINHFFISTRAGYTKEVKELLKNLPSKPGVYKFKDKAGTILYVGKAKNLKNRVSTYFRKGYAHSSRTHKMLSLVSDFEFTETDSELEALLLEHNLIKQLRPKYNILMKDDKSYVYIEVKTNEDFPRIRVIRERSLDKAAQGEKGPVKYFGPKLAANKVYETLRILKKLFPFRHCNLNIAWKGSEEQKKSLSKGGEPEKTSVEVTNRVIDYPCLDYYIKRCPGPCIGAIDPASYRRIIDEVMNFLKGKSEELEQQLEDDMREAAMNKLFEKAARIRDKLFAVQTIVEKQKITNRARVDTDVVNVVGLNGHLYFTLLMIRNGKLTDQENFIFDALEVGEQTSDDELREAIHAFVTQYYERAGEIPREIIVPDVFEETQVLEDWLVKNGASKVTITYPQKGQKNELLELAHKNALAFARQHRIKWLTAQDDEKAAERLGELIGLPQGTPLKRIEGFDISHLGGEQTVASMVVFHKGRALSKDYRHFRLRTVQGKPDDYKSMAEILTRRLKYLTKNETLSLKKATKKDAEFVEKVLGAPTKTPQERPGSTKTFVLREGETLIGAARLTDHKRHLFSLDSIYLDPKKSDEESLLFLIKKLIQGTRDSKARLYARPNEKDRELYQRYGFREIDKVPGEIQAAFNDQKRTKLGTKKTTTKSEGGVLALYATQMGGKDNSFSARPDLLLIDGGKGQLGMVIEVLKKLKIEIPVISLAKRLEEIYVPGFAAPILLQEGDSVLKLLQHIRDESHRFAITFQRSLHRKALLES